MDDYKPGDLVAVIDNRWAKWGAVGTVERVDHDFLDVRFTGSDVTPGLGDVLLLTRSEIRKVTSDAV